MATYLYGLILSRNAPALGAVAGRLLSCGELTAVVRDVQARPSRASLEEIRAHDSTLRAVVSRGVTIVASRFGQTFEDDAQACRSVRERGAAVLEVLTEHDGCVEMRVLVAHVPNQTRHSPTTPAPALSSVGAPGRAYLEQLRAQITAEKSALHVSLAPAIGPTVRRERVELLPDDAGVVFAHLIPRAFEATYRAALAQLPALADAKIIGPLPLYSFAGDPATA